MKWFLSAILLLFSFSASAGTPVKGVDLFHIVDSVSQYTLDSTQRFSTIRIGQSRSFEPIGAPNVPYRSYSFAIPSGAALPQVRFSVVAREILNGVQLSPVPFDTKEGVREEMNLNLYQGYRSRTVVSKSGLCRGTQMVQVNVPLAQYDYSSRQLTLYSRFKLDVTLPQQGSGRMQPVDPFCRTINSKVRSANRITPLRKIVAPLSDSVTLLTSFRVGSEDLTRLSADGVYGVSYDDIARAMSDAGRTHELVGIPVERLVLLTGQVDTLHHRVPVVVNAPHLFEVPIIVRDKGTLQATNGAFDQSDSIYFFGHGSAHWKPIAADFSELSTLPVERYFSHSPYSYYHYYYLGYKKSLTGSRIDTVVNTGVSSSAVISQNMVYQHVEYEKGLRDNYFGTEERDEIDTLSGLEWYWKWVAKGRSDTYNSRSLIPDHLQELPGYRPGDPAYVGVSFFPKRTTSHQFQMSANTLKERFAGLHYTMAINEDPVTLIAGDSVLVSTTQWFQTNALQQSNDVRLVIDNSANTWHAQRFDALSFAYQADNYYQAGGVWLNPALSQGVNTVQVSDTPEHAQALRIRDHEADAIMHLKAGQFTDQLSDTRSVQYFIFTESDIQKVSEITAVPFSPFISQNIESLPAAEYLIVTPYAFAPHAYALKQFRESGRAGYSISTTIVATEDIYRMFSSGRESPVAIRDFIRYYYSQNPSVKYVLLFGDGHYDYRNIRETNHPNRVPPYEIESVGSEDFFTVLDAGELCPFGAYGRDLFLGRVPIETVEQAADYVQKVTTYESRGISDNSEWRNKVMFVSDDFHQLGNDEQRDPIQKHVVQSDALYNTVRSLRPGLFTEHFLLYDYVHDLSRKKGLASKNLTRFLNDGRLLVTFFGHGGTIGWADEDLLREKEFHKLYNATRPTILCSFSCTVGRFEDGTDYMLGELFVRGRGKGAIASVGALRSSYTTNNGIFGHTLIENFFDTSRVVTLGEAIDIAKGADATHSSYRFNSSKYLLLGEPVLRLPESKLSLQVTQFPDTLRGFDSTTVRGSIQGGSGSGMVHLALYESDSAKMLRAEFSTDTTEYEITNMNGRLIYSTLTPYANGSFQTTFITPGTLTVGDTNAVLRAYFWENGSEGMGNYYQDGIVLGKNSAMADSLIDTEKPTIRLGNCIDADYREHYFADEITLAVGACLQIIITDSLALDFSDVPQKGIYYSVAGVWEQARPLYIEQGSKRAVFRIEFNEAQFTSGRYALRIAATDLFDNSMERAVGINLTPTLEQGLIDVYTVPNPMKSTTTFFFKTMNNDFYTTDIKIYNQSGKLVRVIPQALSGRTTWDGRDAWGNYLANGLYYYKVFYTVYGEFENKKFSKVQKLVISR